MPSTDDIFAPYSYTFAPYSYTEDELKAVYSLAHNAFVQGRYQEATRYLGELYT